MQVSGHRQIPHMSDALIEAWSPTLEGAFEASAAGLVSVITDIRRIRKTIKVETPQLRGNDLEELLYAWLEFILVNFDTEKLLLPRASIVIEKQRTKFVLNATASGERFDPDRHVLKREVKAVTYHEMKIAKSARGYRLRFLLDL